MSHVTTIDIEIRDLDALATACRRCGLELTRGQETFLWYAKRRGDCTHAIRVDTSASGYSELREGVESYEIGVTRREDGKGFELQLDPHAGGFGLIERCGVDAQKLRQMYATEVALKTARLQGFSVREVSQADGSIRLLATK